MYMFGGEINWPALPWIAHMHGCDDLDTLCALLLAMRDRRIELDKAT